MGEVASLLLAGESPDYHRLYSDTTPMEKENSLLLDGGGNPDIIPGLHQLHMRDSSLLHDRDKSLGSPLSLLGHRPGKHWVGCWLPPYNLARVEVYVLYLPFVGMHGNGAVFLPCGICLA